MLVRILNAVQRQCYRSGRRADGLAAQEEMARAARDATDETWRRTGLDGWAEGLAEEGRHADAAEVCAELAAIAIEQITGETDHGPLLWYLVPWATQLALAGHHDAALSVIGELAHRERTKLDRRDAQEVVVVYTLLYQATLLDSNGPTEAGREVRQQALGITKSLAIHRESRSWSGYQTTAFTTILAASAAHEELAPDDRIVVGFGWNITHWTPDRRDAYVAGIDLLHALSTSTGPPDLVHLRRRIAVRTAMRDDWKNQLSDQTRPTFDASVETARQWYNANPSAGRRSLVIRPCDDGCDGPVTSGSTDK